MSKKFLLSEEALKSIERQIKGGWSAEEKLRLLCIYWIGKGKEARWVSEFLFISERSVYRYVEGYKESNKTKPDGGGGSSGHLRKDQEKELTDHLEMKVYRSTEEIVRYVLKTFGIQYSRGGMSKWLARQGFRYKCPGRVPFSASIEKQKAFIDMYEQMKDDLEEDEAILFMDGVHPDHQTQAVHGWIRRGKLAQVPSTGKQKRLHYMGAVNITEEKVKHFFKQYEKIDSSRVVDFLTYLSEHNPGKKLKIICDRGAYHTSKETKAYLAKHKHIEFIHLPPRCPNLNLIERLWRFLRENVTYNRYYGHFNEFKEAVDDFLNRKIFTLQSVILKRLKDNFHIITPQFLPT